MLTLLSPALHKFQLRNSYIYQLGFTSYNLGFGAAVSLFLFMMLLVATVFQMQRFRPRWEY